MVLIYICVLSEFYENTSKDFQVTVRTHIHDPDDLSLENVQRTVTPLVGRSELWFLVQVVS